MSDSQPTSSHGSTKCLLLFNYHRHSLSLVLGLPVQALQEQIPDWKKTNARPQKNLAAFQNHGQSQSAMVNIAV